MSGWYSAGAPDAEKVLVDALRDAGIPASRGRTETCAHCGRVEDRLRYGNMETGAKYCTEECLRHDPAWSDDDQWMA